MNVRFEHRKKLTLIGFYAEIGSNEGYVKCPEFWEKEYTEKYARLFETGIAENAADRAIIENKVGSYAICTDSDNGFWYWIAGIYNGGEVPEGFELFTFPESDWAVFSAKGPLPGSIQRLNDEIWNDWAPTASKSYGICTSTTLEVYSGGNPDGIDYECGIMIPVKTGLTDRIFKAVEEDADEILSLYKSMYGGPAGWNEYYPCEDNISFDIENDALFVLKNEKGEIIGAISESFEPDVQKLLCWNDELSPAGELSRLCIRKDMQNRGLSKIMMNYMFDYFREKGKKSVRILVRPENNVALKSYGTLGFRDVGEANVFDVDFVCMELVL